MSTLGEVTAEIRRGLMLIEAGRQSLLRALESVDAARTRLTATLTGSRNPDAERLLGELAQLREQTLAQFDRSGQAEQRLRALLRYLEGGRRSPAAEPPTPAAESQRVSEPVVRRSTAAIRVSGTRGWWRSFGRTCRLVTSGRSPWRLMSKPRWRWLCATAGPLINMW